MEPGHFVQPVRRRFGCRTSCSVGGDVGGDRLARVVAVSFSIRVASSGPWIDYRWRSRQCDRSPCAWGGHRLSRPARVWPSFFRLQRRRRGDQRRGRFVDSGSFARPAHGQEPRPREPTSWRDLRSLRIATGVRRCKPRTSQMSWNSRNLSRDTASSSCHKHCGGQAVGPMGVGFRSAAVALALTSASLVSLPARAGDDGAAPLWQGIGSIFGPVVGFTGLGGGEKPPPIDYREHGKLVLPPNMDLPPPESSATADPSWL